jgi:hypothetical protein
VSAVGVVEADMEVLAVALQGGDGEAVGFGQGGQGGAGEQGLVEVLEFWVFADGTSHGELLKSRFSFLVFGKIM